MTTTTRANGRCAVEDCTSPSRADAMKNAGRWHLVHGQVYSQERRTFVVYSWAEACEPHRESVAAAVRLDVDNWRDRWTVEVRTLDYGTAEASDVTEYAQGIGTDDARLF